MNELDIQDWADNQDIKFGKRGSMYSVSINDHQVFSDTTHDDFTPLWLTEAEMEDVLHGGYSNPAIAQELKEQYEDAKEQAELPAEME